MLHSKGTAEDRPYISILLFRLSLSLSLLLLPSAAAAVCCCCILGPFSLGVCTLQDSSPFLLENFFSSMGSSDPNDPSDPNEDPLEGEETRAEDLEGHGESLAVSLCLP